MVSLTKGTTHLFYKQMRSINKIKREYIKKKILCYHYLKIEYVCANNLWSTLLGFMSQSGWTGLNSVLLSQRQQVSHQDIESPIALWDNLIAPQDANKKGIVLVLNILTLIDHTRSARLLYDSNYMTFSKSSNFFLILLFCLYNVLLI